MIINILNHYYFCCSNDLIEYNENLLTILLTVILILEDLLSKYLITIFSLLYADDLQLSKIPAIIRFISAEPILEELDFLVEKEGKRIIDAFDWVILGGESGLDHGPYRYRPSEVSWYERAINDLKNNTNVAVFNKQLGCHLRNKLKLKHYHGGEMKEWPKNLQVREFPVKEVEYQVQ